MRVSAPPARAQAIAWFNFEAIGKSAARMDYKKLDNLNGHYIRQTADDVLAAELVTFLGLLTPPQTLSGMAQERLRAAMESFRAAHRHLCLDPEARNVRHTYVTPAEDKRTWRVQQMLVDPDAHNDWVAEFTVDLSVSRATGEPALRLVRIGSLG